PPPPPPPPGFLIIRRQRKYTRAKYGRQVHFFIRDSPFTQAWGVAFIRPGTNQVGVMVSIVCFV
ncbi:hypothetical protein ACVGXU_03915, partial [Enterobacter hormaechei]